MLACTAGIALAAPQGAYDGSYDPASPTPPVGMTSWSVVQGHACSITPNRPAPGQATFVDDGLQIGCYLNLKKALDSEQDFGGRATDTEYEYSLRVKVESAGLATLPNFQVGFRDEGGGGRCVCLAWYRTAPHECLLAFMQPSAGPARPVTYWNWLDDTPHTYTVKKYRDPQRGTMLVQVLIDGVPQFQTPIPYDSLPHDTSSHEGFQFGTSSYTTGRYVVDDIRFGPLLGVPPVAAQDAMLATAAGAEATLPVPGPWQRLDLGAAAGGSVQQAAGMVSLNVAASARAVSGRLSLTPNRAYTIRGTCRAAAEVAAATLIFKQFAANYGESLPPDQCMSLPLTPPGTAVAFEFPVYLRLGSGLATLTLTASGPGGTLTLRDLTVSGGGPYRPGYLSVPPEEPAYSAAAIATRLAERSAPLGAIVNPNGFPFLRLGAEQFPPFFHVGPMVTSTESGWWGAFGKAGVHLQSVHGRLSSEGLSALWTGPGQYDYAALDTLVRRVLSRDAEARVILGVWLDPYAGWGLEHRDDVCQNAAGLYALGKHHFAGWGKEPGNLRLLPSIFSRQAAADIVEMLGAVDQWLSANEIGKAVVGFYLWGFNDADFGHWVHPCTSAGEKDPDDYSPAAVNAWRGWLHARYEGDANRLRASWRRPDVDLATVALPSPERRRGTGGDSFPWLLDRADREIVDFNRFYGEAPARFVGDIITSVRQRTGTGRFLVLHQGNAMHGWRGYTGFGTISRVPGLDCISATSDYGLRVPGYPGGCDSLPESLGLQGKLFFHEFDYRSHCAPTQFENMDFGVGRSSDAAMHRAMLLREGVNMLARGHGIYCMDMDGQWYGDPEILRGVKDIYGLLGRQLALDGPAHADVAYFLGEDSINYLGDSEEASRFLMRVTRRHRPEWDTSGVPYHLYLQRDLADPRLPAYKVYVFLLPQAIDPAERQAIEALKRDGKTLVFLHAPGLCEAPDATAAIQAVTGMRAVRLPGNDIPLAGTWLKAEHPLLDQLAGPFGDRPIAWRFTDRESRGLAFAIADPQATPLAAYRDHPDAVAAAVRDFGTWRSVYLAVPWLEARFMANLARTAGAWRAAEPHDAVFANQHVIGIHAMAAGTKTLRPYTRSRVTDALTGEVVADGAEQFTVDLPFGVTRVFRTEGVE